MRMIHQDPETDARNAHVPLRDTHYRAYAFWGTITATGVGEAIVGVLKAFGMHARCKRGIPC